MELSDFSGASTAELRIPWTRIRRYTERVRWQTETPKQIRKRQTTLTSPNRTRGEVAAGNYVDVVCRRSRRFAEEICDTLGMAPKNNARFARIIGEAFDALGVTQDFFHDELGGPSDSTLRKIIEGKQVGISAQTLNAFDKAFAWTPGSAARTLAGGNPVSDPSGDESVTDTPTARIGAGDDKFAGVRHTIEHEWAAATEFAEDLLSIEPPVDVRLSAFKFLRYFSSFLSERIIRASLNLQQQDELLEDIYRYRRELASRLDVFDAIRKDVEEGVRDDRTPTQSELDLAVRLRQSRDSTASAQAKTQEAGSVVGSAMDDTQQRPIADILYTEPGDQDTGVDGTEDGEGRKNLGGQ